MRISEQELYQKIYGCWIGKSIGGTLGAPFEARQELLDVTDFTSPSGKPLPNDDLDLQLVWLKALEEKGPLGVNERVLGEYWITYIPPHWNEYGIGKGNMKAGLPPPLSGDYQNVWRHSNGAWIRSEIWACCAPGCPEIATKYAWCDAVVDHGTGEGTYAELFTASVESAAFVEKDRDTLIQIGLSHIPEDCRVARSIGIALDGYRRGLSWQESRQLVLEDSADLGWFQAPANVAFLVIGWLYGEGDFKRSLLIAVSCGDDTDCTGGTLGSILGIIGGVDSIPADWRRHVGDDIITMAIDRGSFHHNPVPSTCTELSERTLAMCRLVLADHRAPAAFADGALVIPERSMMASEGYLKWLAGLDGAAEYDFIHTTVRVRYVSGIDVAPLGEACVEVSLKNRMLEPRHVSVEYLLPEGFTLVEGPSHLMHSHFNPGYTGIVTFTARMQAGARPAAANHGVIRMVASGRPTVMLVPLLFFGK